MIITYPCLESFVVWKVMTKAIEKDKVLLEMMMGIGSASEAWCALTKIVAETKDAAYGRAKNDCESLEIGTNETIGEYGFRKREPCRDETTETQK